MKRFAIYIDFEDDDNIKEHGRWEIGMHLRRLISDELKYYEESYPNYKITSEWKEYDEQADY